MNVKDAKKWQENWKATHGSDSSNSGSQSGGSAPTTGGNAPPKPNSGSPGKSMTPAEAKKWQQDWIAYNNYQNQPKLEDFSNANPLSAAVQSLTNQRDAIANATPGKNDTLTSYMQRRGLSELDTAIQNQTAKERADAFRAGTDPITGTLLNPIGDETIPMSALTPVANPEFMERPRPTELGISELLASGTKNWQQEQAGRAARNKVNPQTVVDVRKQIQDIDNQINQLDTNTAMVALSGTDTSETAAERQALSDRRDYLTGELNRYQSALQPEFDALTEQISDLAIQFKDSKDQAERFELFDQITALNAQQKQLMDALGIENKPIVNWDGRDDLIKEYRRLSRADRPNPAQQARLDEVRRQLEEGDALTGNGLQSYFFGDRVSNIFQGTGRNIGSTLLNAGATWFDAYSRGQSQQYGLGTAVSDQLAGIDPMSRIEMQTADYNSEESQALRQAMYDTADSIGEKAREDLEKAKSQLGSVGKAGVDIAENVLEMGFDIGFGAMTGGGSLPSMFFRVFGGAAQEARQAGASLDEQLAYAFTKGGIEVATEKMFDGVAHIYGAGAADEITEELIRKLADSDTGRTFLRMVISGQGEGIEEVVSELLDPLAKSIYADESVGELYKNVNPADVLYSYIIGSTIGFFGGATEVATGANALSNAELRMRDAGLGVDAQTNNAWEALTGGAQNVALSPGAEEVSAADRVNARERAARIRLGLDPETGLAPATERTTAAEAPVETAPASEETSPAETAPTVADTLVETLQNKNAETGKVSNSVAETIINDPELKAEFEKASGVEIKGSKSEQRSIVKDNGDAVISALTGDTTEAPATVVENAPTTPAETVKRGGRSAEERAAAEERARTNDRQYHESLDSDRRQYLDNKYRELKGAVDGLQVGDTIIDNDSGSVIGKVTTADEHRVIIQTIVDGEVTGASIVYKDSSEGNGFFTDSGEYLLDGVTSHIEKANTEQANPAADALLGTEPTTTQAEPTVANNAPVENNAENLQQSATEQSEGINTPAEAEAKNIAETPQEETAETVPQAEEREYTETQKRLGEYLGLGESITTEEIDTILDSKPMMRAMQSFGFVENGGTLSEQRQAVRDFAKKIAEEGIPSEKAVTKAEQDREIRTREQELQYQLDKVNEELEAAIQQGDIEKRKALEKQRQRILRKTRRGKALSKITSKANDLTKTLTKAKESRYVPAEFVEATTEFIEALNEARVDRTSETKTAQRAAAKFDRIAQEFAKLKDAQTKLENDRGIAIGVGYDEDVAAAMEECRKMLAETPLNQMDADDLENIANTLTAMQHAISKARNFSLKGRKGTAAEIMQDLMRETQNEATGGDSLGTKYVDSMSRPETFFNKLGGWAKNSVWHGMYEMLNRGQKKAIDLKLRAQDMFSDLIAETKNYRTLRDEVKLNGLKDADGNVIPISRGMMLSLYMHLMNEQNTNHITGGGLTIADVADYYKNRHDKGFGVGRTRAAGMSAEMSDLNYQYRQAKATGDTALMEDIQDQMDVLRENEAERLQTLRSDIENQLTDYEKRFIEKAQSFFSWAQTNLNETTLDVYGFLKATVDNYFPIDSDPHHRQSTSSETETARNNKSLEQSGILKQRTNANNPIMLMDISDVLNDYINQMAQYSGLMPAIKTFNQIYKAQLAGNKTNVRDVLSAKFGNAAENYINNLIDDLQGSRKVKGGVLESMLSTTRGNFAASVLTLNARVALSQRASYFNAASVLGWRNLAAGLTMKKPDLGLIRQYSPLLQARTSDSKTQKFSDNRTDLQSQRDRITRKLGFMLNWINDADNDTVRSLWNAAEMKVQNETDLAEGTDAYYKEVGRLFDEAVERTQPGYEVMQRPDLLRDPSSLTRTLTMFMTQRLQNFNEVYDRIQQARKFGEDYENGLNGVTKADVAEANRSARNAISGVITSSLALTIMKAGVDALLHRTKNYRDDETGELTPESVLLRIMDYTAESLASNVWLGAEAYQTGKRLINGGRYYGTSVPGIDTISDTVENIIKVLRASEEKRPEALMKAAGSAAALFGGIPFDNAKGYVESVIKWAEDFQNQTFLESDANYTTAQNKRIVYDALTGGEDPRLFKVGDRYEQAMARMGDNAEANARDAVKAHYDAGDIDTVDAVAALTNIGFDNGMDTVRKWREKNKYDKFVEENPETSLNQTAYTRYNDSNDKPDFDTFDKAISDMSNATGKSFGDLSQSEATEYLAFSDIPEDQQEKIYNLMFPNAAKEYGEQDLVVASKQMGDEASLDTYNEIMSFIDEKISERTNEYDTKGYNEVMSALLDYDAGDGVKDAAMARAGTKTNSVYQALREDGEMPANDALSLILGIDGTSTKNKKYLNNGSINQDELKAYFKEHPEEEAEIAIVWDSMEYKKNGKIFTWEDYANNGYKK